MNTNELSAQYICEDEERLRMALHVYEAMPAVREHLIKAIFNAAGERVAEEIDGVKQEPHENGVYLWTEETGDFYVFAELEPGKKSALRLTAGIYVDDAKSINKAQREEVRERFGTEVDLKTWSYGESFSQGEYVAYAYVHHKHGGHWHDDGFLSQAILSRDEVVSNVAQILVGIYKGMWPR